MKQCVEKSERVLRDASPLGNPEMHQTKKGNQWYFGMKPHIAVHPSSWKTGCLATCPLRHFTSSVCTAVSLVLACTSRSRIGLTGATGEWPRAEAPQGHSAAVLPGARRHSLSMERRLRGGSDALSGGRALQPQQRPWRPKQAEAEAERCREAPRTSGDSEAK